MKRAFLVFCLSLFGLSNDVWLKAAEHKVLPGIYISDGIEKPAWTQRVNGPHMALPKHLPPCTAVKLLRFYEDGSVIGADNCLSKDQKIGVPQIKTWFKKEMQDGNRVSTYVLSGDQLTFKWKVYPNSEEVFRGTIRGPEIVFDIDVQNVQPTVYTQKALRFRLIK